MALPSQMLSIDLAQIGHEEGVLLAGLAVLMVYVFYAVAESVSN